MKNRENRKQKFADNEVFKHFEFTCIFNIILNICRNYSKSESEIHEDRDNTVLRVKKSNVKIRN